MTRSLNDLALEVARGMNLLRPGEDLDQGQAAHIIDKATQVHARLVDKGAAYWPADKIPEPVFMVVAEIVIFEVAPHFGALPVVLQSFGYPNKLAAWAAGLKQLRIHCEKEDNHERARILEY